MSIIYVNNKQIRCIQQFLKTISIIYNTSVIGIMLAATLCHRRKNKIRKRISRGKSLNIPHSTAFPILYCRFYSDSTIFPCAILQSESSFTSNRLKIIIRVLKSKTWLIAFLYTGQGSSMKTNINVRA